MESHIRLFWPGDPSSARRDRHLLANTAESTACGRGPSGMSVSIHGRVRAVTGDVMDCEAAIIDLSKLPLGTTKIRVYAS